MPEKKIYDFNLDSLSNEIHKEIIRAIETQLEKCVEMAQSLPEKSRAHKLYEYRASLLDKALKHIYSIIDKKFDIK